MGSGRHLIDKPGSASAGEVGLAFRVRRMPTDRGRRLGGKVFRTTYGAVTSTVPPLMQYCHLLANPHTWGLTIGGETTDA